MSPTKIRAAARTMQDGLQEHTSFFTAGPTNCPGSVVRAPRPGNRNRNPIQRCGSLGIPGTAWVGYSKLSNAFTSQIGMIHHLYKLWEPVQIRQKHNRSNRNGKLPFPFGSTKCTTSTHFKRCKGVL
eukprot:2296905-Rhodomonas_salina.1